MEHRKQKRYILNVPVLFLWALHDREPQSGRGITRDINTFGVHVITDAVPPVGARVQMEIALPKVSETGCGMQLTCEGVVLRRESDDPANRSVAASAQLYPETAGVLLSQLKISEKPRFL
jgi:hypothetical protein